jgi:hypothetical protein
MGLTENSVRIESAASGVALTFLLGGCAVHPLPKDVTGVSTYEIVRQIRCETRQAVIDSALEYLTKGTDVDPSSREIGLRFAAEPSSIEKLSPKLFKGQVHDLLSIFWTTGVAYNYNLDMTEINNASAELDFLKTLTKGTLGFGLNGHFDRQRQNTRTFTITDNFGDLVRKPMDCTGRLVGENYIYPITGRIGVDEMVHAFVYLSLFGNLAGEKDNSKGPPTLVDALEFTTTISGSATPKVDFAPIGRNLSVSHADLAAAVSRTDKHQVVVGLALEKAAQAQLEPARAGLQAQLVPLHGELFLLTASGNRAEIRAATAVDQFLTQRLFSPTINITP